jgi:hypothetical protein
MNTTQSSLMLKNKNFSLVLVTVFLVLLSGSLFSSISGNAASGKIVIKNNFSNTQSVAICVDNIAVTTSLTPNTTLSLDKIAGNYAVKVIPTEYFKPEFCLLSSFPVISSLTLDVVDNKDTILSLEGSPTPNTEPTFIYTGVIGAGTSGGTGDLRALLNTFRNGVQNLSAVCIDGVLTNEQSPRTGLYTAGIGDHILAYPTFNAGGVASCPTSSRNPNINIRVSEVSFIEVIFNETLNPLVRYSGFNTTIQSVDAVNSNSTNISTTTLNNGSNLVAVSGSGSTGLTNSTLIRTGGENKSVSLTVILSFVVLSSLWILSLTEYQSNH